MFDAEKHAGEVDADRSLPLLERQLMQRQCTLFDSRVVVGAIEATVGLDGVLDQSLDVTLGGQVGGEEAPFRPAPVMALAVSRPRSAAMSVTTTFAPALASTIEASRPIPPPAPVTTMVLPCRIPGTDTSPNTSTREPQAQAGSRCRHRKGPRNGESNHVWICRQYPPGILCIISTSGRA